MGILSTTPRNRINRTNLVSVNCQNNSTTDTQNQHNGANFLPHVLMTNCQSLTHSKRDELAMIARQEDIDVVLLTETWIDTTKESSLPGYNLYTSNRAKQKGGGCAILVASKLNAQCLRKYTHISDTTSGEKYSLTPHQLRHSYTVVPTILPDEDTTIRYITSTLTELLAGDFNKLDCSEVTNTFRLSRIVQFNTRKDSCLDKFFTNCSVYSADSTSKSAPLGKSDHCCILVKRGKQQVAKSQSTKRRVVSPGSRINIFVM